MCVYTTQDSDFTNKYSNWKDLVTRSIQPITKWIESPEFLEVDRPQFKDRSPVIGIGNWATIQYKQGDDYWWDWAKFAPSVSMWPGGKAMPYYNAKVETLVGYIEENKRGPFPARVRDDLQNRTCVFWVNAFFESNGSKSNPRWFHIHREDNKMIPLAAFYHIDDDPDSGTAWPSFTIITRDPYPLVAETGHPRSPGILPHEYFMDWMDTSLPIYDRLSLITETADGEYVIDEVEKSNVTKRTEHATEPIEGGRAVIVGELE